MKVKLFPLGGSPAIRFESLLKRCVFPICMCYLPICYASPFLVSECPVLRYIGKSKLGFAPYELIGMSDDRPANKGAQLFPNVDLDGDDISEEIIRACPNTTSTEIADPCKVSILYSRKKSISSLTRERLFLFRFHSGIYIAATPLDAKSNKSDLFMVDEQGITQICK